MEVAEGLSCDEHRGGDVTCKLSAWVCGQRGEGWETRTLTLKYTDGRSKSMWESRSPCRGKNYTLLFIRGHSLDHGYR